MTPDLVVQNIVTALILGGVAWFAVRRIRRAAHSPKVLHDGDEISLIRVRHINNGGDLFRGKANDAAGGSLTVGSSFMTLNCVFGAERIDYAQIEKPRIRNHGLTRILVFEVTGESEYWALWVRRNKATALVAHLAGKGVTATP